MAKDKTTTKITRIKATDSGAEKAAVSAKTDTTGAKKSSKKPATVVKPARTASKNTKATTPGDKTKADLNTPTEKKGNILKRLKDYFAGAWYELRQVRWPDRKATWGMTGALLLFTAFFVTLILLIDALFRYLFELIIR